ncbi:MAG: hypothetical protein ACOYN5_10785 [Bacteroidales bacterium]|jgi:hypothetical protein
MYPTDYIISKYLAESKNYAVGELNVWNDIYTGNINSDLVIYGSSRAWVHINPKIIEDSLQISSYNLGIEGHNFWLQYFRHKELLKFNKKPAHIIMSLDIFTLQKRCDLYNYQQFLPFLLLNNDIYQYTSSYIGFSTFDYYIPLCRYFLESGALKAAFRSMIDCKIVPSRIRGYMGMEKNWTNDLDRAKSKVDYYEVKLDSSTVNLFEKFINECSNNNIKITLVFSPEYIEGQFFVKNRKEIISKYQHFANKYSLQFIDYSKDTMCMQKQFFYNSEHLNKKGSEIFTNKLIKDIRVHHGNKRL